MTRHFAGALAIVFGLACGEDGPEVPPPPGVTFRSDISPVTRVEDALPGVFIPPFLDCRDPVAGDVASGQVCTHVSIAGATEPGKSFASYASCDVVRTQRPYWPAPPAKVPAVDDPRLGDPAYATELAWAKAQLGASGCACCHDGVQTPSGASQWDIGAPGIWLDTLSDSGLALFTGLADSSVLGAYAPADNHGFDRTQLGVPTNDVARMRAFMMSELARRGMTEESARQIPPFGGPIYQNSVRPPVPCGPDEGIDPDGRVWFRSEEARYVYVLAEGSRNPGVPPNLDRPEGTLWRLDVLPSAPAITSGLLYGSTRRGTYQDTPAASAAPKLIEGQTYQLTALLDVGIPIVNCTFVFGAPVMRSQ